MIGGLRVHASAILVMATAACTTPHYASKDQVMVEIGRSSWTTHCIGRFLIDLPADAEYVGGNYEYGFVSIERQSMDRGTFDKEVNDLETQLRESKNKDVSLLLKKSAPNDDTRVFGFWLDHDQRVRVKISGYRWLNGMRYLARNSADPDKLDGAVMRQEAILSSLRAMDSTSPTSKGFCVEQALIADDGTSKHENLNIRFRLTNHPDIVLDVATKRNSSAPPNLYCHVSQASLAAWEHSARL